ncbi:hypothetical protein BRC64_06285 [Halobacteriales archaeon QH_10_67_22]|nr:MAG: hypothetical protein BRC64_06285 [Halobacteriales archaeon QH_10_67_22]
MSVSGLCEVCQQPDVDHSCDRCGRLVCDDHFDEHAGFCVECTAELGGGRPGQGGAEERPDGVDTYRS